LFLEKKQTYDVARKEIGNKAQTKEKSKTAVNI
jgi:hypothetical protein